LPAAAAAAAGFFFPQGFLTGVLQAHARSSGTPIDRLAFGFAVCSSAAGPADVTAAPEVGVYVHGLYLEAARWVYSSFHI
jgi:dynein heavy chain